MSQRFQAEIVCRFRRDRVSFSSGARKPRSCVDFAEIVYRFRQVKDWGTLEIGSVLVNLHRGEELLGEEVVEEVDEEKKEIQNSATAENSRTG